MEDFPGGLKALKRALEACLGVMDAYPRVGEAHSEAEVVHPGAVEANPELWKLILKARGHSDAINSHPETVEAHFEAMKAHFLKLLHILESFGITWSTEILEDDHGAGNALPWGYGVLL